MEHHEPSFNRRTVARSMDDHVRWVRYQFLNEHLHFVIPGTSWHQQEHRQDVHELDNITLTFGVPETIEGLQESFKPNLPWAEDHFQERVSGEPMNPPPSSEWWPFAQAGHKAHLDGGKFSHTYPERFWPSKAEIESREGDYLFGIREYAGDLGNVVKLLIKDPTTRQAYLPVWFPEDTGNPADVRVPCSLGYHFEIRDTALTVTYMIRSCDFMRHFRDDMYLAARLGQWMAEQVTEELIKKANQPGPRIECYRLVAHIMSLHVFEDDIPILRNTDKP